MYRRRFRARRSLARAARWAREATVVDLGGITMASDQNVNLVVVPPVNVQGNRRISNILLRVAWAAPVPVAYALVYIPSGTAPSPLGTGGVVSLNTSGQIPEGQTLSSLYEPNQNVLTQGVIAPNAGQVTSVSYAGPRVLGSGDCIALVCKNYFTTQVANNPGIVMVSFSVAY